MNRIRNWLRWPGGNDMTPRAWFDFALVVAFIVFVTWRMGATL